MKIFLLCFALLLAGCGNPFQENYVPIATSGHLEYCAEPQVLKNNQIGQETFSALLEKGYMPIGYSQFDGSELSFDEDLVRDQARELGACIAVYGASYSYTEQSLQAVKRPSMYFPSLVGMGLARQEYEIDFVPVSTRIYDISAIFAVKDRSPVTLGLYLTEAPEEYKKAQDTVTGLLIAAVRDPSPAQAAAVFRGDVLMSLNGTPVTTQNYESLIKKGDENTIVIYRNGTILTKTFRSE